MIKFLRIAFSILVLSGALAVHAQKKTFPVLSQESVRKAVNVRSLLALADSTTDYSSFEFVSFDIDVDYTSISISLPGNNGVAFSDVQKQSILKAEPAVYHICRIKALKPGTKKYIGLEPVTFTVK